MKRQSDVSLLPIVVPRLAAPMFTIPVHQEDL
jgi:hypothetical protein